MLEMYEKKYFFDKVANTKPLVDIALKLFNTLIWSFVFKIIWLQPKYSVIPATKTIYMPTFEIITETN